MRAFVSVVVLVATAGCAPAGSSAPPPPADTPASFGSDAATPIDPFASDAGLGARVNQVFGGSGCQGGPELACHAMGEAALHLRLGPSGDVVGVAASERPSLKRVEPGDPVNSYLYLKVLGDGGIDGGRMPLGGDFDPRLPPLLAEWIEAGAPDP